MERSKLALGWIPYEVLVAPDMIMQIFRDIAGCPINTTSHIEGWHSTLKVSRNLDASLPCLGQIHLQFKQHPLIRSAWLQGTFLTGKRRLQNRRIDWLLWILVSQVTEAFTVRAFAQADGAVSNLKAHKAMNTALLRAKSQPDDTVTMVGDHAAKVKSATDGNVEYDVTLPQDGSDQITCSCQAGRFNAICWHTVKVLQRKGATDNLLLRHMGIQLGSKMGGYQILMQAVAAVAAAALADHDSSQVDANPSMDDAAAMTDDAAPMMEHQEAGDEGLTSESDGAGISAQDARRQPRMTARCNAEAALARLAACGQAWPDDSPNWQWLALAANKAFEEVERMVSNARITGLQKSNSLPAYFPNAAAPADNSLKRKKTKLEECALRMQAAANAALPFMPLSVPRKPQTVLQEIRAKNSLLGVVSSAPTAAAAMERANSAPEPLVVGRASPVAPSQGAPEAGSSTGAMELQKHRSEPLVKQASVSLLRSAGAIASAHGRSKRAATRPSRFRDGAE